jgi:transcription elongation factor Elf1
VKIKISATFEGKCDLCNKENVTVFTIGDEESKKVVTICKECSDNFGDKKTEDVIKIFGKFDEKAFEPGIKIEGKSIAV